MFLKKKHIIVVMVSSFIVSLVLVSTILGYNLYLQYKKDTFRIKYRNSIAKITADLFSKDLVLSNMKIRFYENDAKIPADMPVFEGAVKNNSNKTVTLLIIEMSFQDPNGRVLYKDWFYPIGEGRSENISSHYAGNRTGRVLLPGEGVSFRYILKNCSADLAREISYDPSFAKSEPNKNVKLECSISGMNVL